MRYSLNGKDVQKLTQTFQLAKKGGLRNLSASQHQQLLDYVSKLRKDNLVLLASVTVPLEAVDMMLRTIESTLKKQIEVEVADFPKL